MTELLWAGLYVLLIVLAVRQSLRWARWLDREEPDLGPPPPPDDGL